MKKRLLSALLALALVFVLLPTTALAETPAIKIAGTVIEDGKYYYTNGGIGELKTEAQQKTWNVRRDGNTLYLKNAKINTTDTQSIQVWMMSVTINLEGDSTITTKGEGSIVSQFAGSLTIKGNGKLTIESNTAGSSIVWNSGDVTITGDAVVNITNKNSGQLSEAIGLTNSYELTVSGNAKLKAVSNGSKAATVNGGNLTIADNAEFNVINQNSSGKAVSFKSIEVAAGYDCNGINGNGITDWTKTTAEELNTFQKVWVKPTPTPTLEKSNVYVAGTNLYKNTAYTIQNGKPVMGGTYPDNYNIYLDATNYVLHVKNADIDATGKTGISGTSNIVFEGTNSITASTYGIYSDFKSSNLNISGSGFLTVETYAGNSAIATAYTSMSIIISGQGFTVTADTSRTNVSAIYSDKGGLTIKDGATVKAISANNSRAIRIGGSLTVTDATLTATSTSDRKPTIEVEGGATLAGSEVKITNNSTRQGTSGENSYGVSTGLYVGGTLDIKNAAKVTSTVIGGNAIYAKGDITISGDSTEVNAQNSAYKFSAISTNGTVNISDNSTVKAENLKRHQGDPTGETDPSTGKTYNACPAITGKIANKNTQNKLHIAGFTTSSAGSQNPTEGTPLNRDIAPSSVEPYIHHYKVTITRGDEVARTQSPVVIAGTTLLNDTYYTITNGSKVAEGTDSSNYNAFYNSETKTLKLNNAKISTTTNNAAIKIGEDAFATYTITVTGTNELQGNYNHCIESYSSFKINGDGTLEMTNGSNTTASVIYCGPDKSLTIGAEVIFKNNSNSGVLLGMVEKDAYSFAEGYNVYASTNVSGSPLEAYDAAKGSTYKYLRVTKENLAPTTPTPQTPFTIYGIPAQFVDGGMIATTGVTATSSNNINLPIDRVEWYTFTPGFRPDGSMDSVINKTKATGNFEAGKYYVVEIRFVQDLSPFESWDMKVSGWSDNDVSRQSVTARNDIEIYFLTPASAATHEHNWAEKYDTVYHWKMCTYDGCTAISGKAPHEWTGWWVDDYRPEVHAQRCNCGYLGSTHSTLKYVAINGEQHQKQCPVDGCDYKIESSTTAHVYAEGSNICTDCGYNKSAPCDHGNRAYTNNGDGTHKVTCKACGATIVEKQSHEFGPTGACIYCGATQSGGDPTPDNPGTIVIIRPAEEEKPAQQPNPSTGANDLVGLAVAAAVAAAAAPTRSIPAPGFSGANCRRQKPMAAASRASAAL